MGQTPPRSSMQRILQSPPRSRFKRYWLGAWRWAPLALLLVPWGLCNGPIRDGDLAEWKAKLSSPQKRVRRSALGPLVSLDSLVAWELVVKALGDSAGEVADGAQLLLGEMDDPGELELMLGKSGLRSKSDWVRRRVVEALGRVQAPVPIGALQRGLKDRDAEVRRMAAWSIERLAQGEAWLEGLDARERRELAGKLRACASSDRDPTVQARALCALVPLDPEAARVLWKSFTKGRSIGLRCVALKLAPALMDPELALAALAAAAQGPELLLRGQAQETLAQWGTKPALGALIECFPLEEDPRLAFLLLQRLRALSGLKHRADVRPWRAWCAQLTDDWRAPEPRTAATERKATPRDDASSSLSFSGLELRSLRLSFLIDLSGSMWTPGADGRTAKQVVEGKLASALEGLPEEARFNLIPYTSKPIPWADSLQPASKRNKARALAHFADCSQRGSGNFWAAAMLALEDPEVDTLVVLSDGAPSGGERYELDLIVSHFEELNLTRRVAVDSVLVDASWRLQGYWQRLAACTGGESISVAFP